MRARPALFDELGTALLADCPPENPYLIGVSGGRDSIALLHWLHSLGFHQLIVCHFDHQLRPESPEDNLFVIEHAATLGLECLSTREDIRIRARQTQQSLETAGRAARYDFFAHVGAQRDCHTLFLAHHADDQVETVLFNLLRGAGPAGLAAMPALSRRLIAGLELTLRRPWLGVWRSEIDQYITSNHLNYREDASNSELHPSRNRLRHKVLPQLEQLMGRDVRRAIWRTAELLRADEDFLQSQVPPITPELSVPSLQALPESIQRRTLHSWLKTEGVPQVTFDTVERTRALLHTTQAKANLPGAMHVRRRAKKIFIEKPGSPPK